MDLVKPFESYCQYVLKYKTRFNQLNNNELGYFKRHKDQYQTLKSAVQNIDICVSNLSSSLSHLLLKIPIEHIKNDIYQILILLISDNPNFGGNSGVLGNYQINLLKELKEKVDSQFSQESQIVINRPNNTNASTSESTLNTLDTQKQYDDVKGLYKRVFKKEISLKVFDYHKQNGTAPKEISIHNFPPPFLSHDKDFIKDYDALIKSFQVQIMDLCIKRVNQQINSFRSKIEDIKTNLSNNRVENIENQLDNIKKQIETNWKTIGDSAMEKAQRIIIKSFSVRQPNNNVSVDEGWFIRERNNNQENSNQNSFVRENQTLINGRNRSRSRGRINNRHNRGRSNSNNHNRNNHNNQEYRQNYINSTPNNSYSRSDSIIRFNNNNQSNYTRRGYFNNRRELNNVNGGNNSYNSYTYNNINRNKNNNNRSFRYQNNNRSFRNFRSPSRQNRYN